MTARDWGSLFIMVIGSAGWFLSWWNHRVLMIELRGVKGYKFRALWREYARQHDIPINGEDSD